MVIESSDSLCLTAPRKLTPVRTSSNEKFPEAGGVRGNRLQRRGRDSAVMEASHFLMVGLVVWV